MTRAYVTECGGGGPIQCTAGHTANPPRSSKNKSTMAILGIPAYIERDAQRVEKAIDIERERDGRRTLKENREGRRVERPS